MNADHAVVSLTFDDGLACQTTALKMLDERSLFGTFYVGSDFIGRSTHLGWGTLANAQATGHEVGGHGLSHLHLPEVSTRRARRAVFDDRSALLEHGLEPLTFAYPYGEHDATVRQLAAEAGYVGARSVGGVVETVPPDDRFALRTPHSARLWTSADDLAAFVRVAEHEACWAILVFHHICETHTSDYSTPPREFGRFLDWLVTRDVDVVRVRDVLAAPAPAQVLAK